MISSSILGGAQLYIVHLIEKLMGEFEIVVICPEGFLSQKIYSLHYSEIKVIEEKINFRNIHRLKGILYELCRNTHESGKIIINVHLLGTAFYTILSLPRDLQYRFIVTLHQPILYNNIKLIKRILYPFIIKKISDRVDEYIAVSEEIKDSLTQYTTKKCTYITNTVPDIMPKKNLKNISKKEKVEVGVIGRLTDQKNQFCFIDAAKEICKEKDNVDFYIIGEGELKDRLQNYSEKKGLGKKVLFVGAVDNPYDWMRRLDILVFSSDFEGIPLTMLEAMSIGLPVISTDVGGVPQIITNGQNGILVKARQPRQISDAVLGLINDQEKYEDLHKNGITFMNKKLNYSEFISSYKKVLED